VTNPKETSGPLCITGTTGSVIAAASRSTRSRYPLGEVPHVERGVFCRELARVDDDAVRARVVHERAGVGRHLLERGPHAEESSLRDGAEERRVAVDGLLRPG
jgi:hypothetical protein